MPKLKKDSGYLMFPCLNKTKQKEKGQCIKKNLYEPRRKPFEKQFYYTMLLKLWYFKLDEEKVVFAQIFTTRTKFLRSKNDWICVRFYDIKKDVRLNFVCFFFFFLYCFLTLLFRHHLNTFIVLMLSTFPIRTKLFFCGVII